MYFINLSCIPLSKAPFGEDIIVVSILLMEVINYGEQILNIHFLGFNLQATGR
jgi:hypothetical protein